MTPHGNIRCGDITVYLAREFGNGKATTDLSKHQTNCYPAKFSFAPPPCAFGHSCDAYLESTGYPEFVCGGEEDAKAFIGSNPYQAHDGELLNLGPSVCRVHTSYVDCAEQFGQKHGFQLSQLSFLSPLAQDDSVKVLSPFARGPYSLASNGKFEPKELTTSPSTG